MLVNDPIADMLTRIRNALVAKHDSILVPASNEKKAVAKILLDKILADYDYAGGEVALLVNGLGGTPLAELYILNNEVQALLAEANVKVYKTFVGNYMTAIEMAGCSLTLMKLDDELKALLDAPADTPALKVL